jgi:uncharacterized protein YmfQ (DUF2313 family)
MRTALEYLRLLQSLLPKGFAWNREEGSGLTEFLHGEAEEFSRVDSRSDDLVLLERDTRFASELLVDHETDLGLPDECSAGNETIQERRRIANTRLITLGQQNPAYFIELAAAYGYTITITEYTPFWCGIGRSGDPCGDQKTIFYWKVTIAYGGENIVYFQSGSSESGDAISYIPGTTSFICMLNKYKPAHTTIIYDYDGPEFDEAFSSAFDALPSSDEDYLEGGFWRGFGQGFDVNYGGDFNTDAFGAGFKLPA